MTKVVAGVAVLLVSSGALAETLVEVLLDADVPVEQFSAAERAGKITSYAVSKDDPFLLAYYVDDGSGGLQPPLHIIRYDRSRGDLRRASIREAKAPFQDASPMDCLGSALRIREHRGFLYIETHLNPSAGCVLVLSSGLELRAEFSGWIVGLMGADYAIVRRSEIHFMSAHPMHLAVVDLKRNRAVEVYPYENDPQRRAFSRLIEPHISEKSCGEHNAQCDPENFDVNVGKVALNEAARVFAFEAVFDAGGFGDTAEKRVRPQTVTYIFRERGGKWEHREFDAAGFRRLAGGMSIGKFIAGHPDAAFQPAAAK